MLGKRSRNGLDNEGIHRKGRFMKLEGKVAIVTGAGSGIGEATAKLFAQEGARVVVLDVNAEGIDRVTKAIGAAGGLALGAKVDVSQSQEVSDMMAKVISEFGRVDILINNAGIFRDAMSWKMTDEQWDQTVDVCLKGSFLCCRAVIPHMRAQSYGKIVNTASIAVLGTPGQANYSAAKAGVVAMTKVLALELGRAGVNVNCVAPGSINTPILQAMPQEILQKGIQEKTPLRRIGQPEEVAKLHLFLVSEDSSYITGQLIFIDGGISVGI